jgi:hypothetical protein
MESTYQINLPDYPRWVKALAYLVAAIAIIGAIAASLAFHDVKPLFIGILGAFLPAYFRKRSGSPLPSRLEIQPNKLIAYDFPEFDFNYTHGPINILPEFSFDLDQSSFEWIDGWLFINHRASGSSLKLCQDANHEKLTKWLQSNGYQVIGS